METAFSISEYRLFFLFRIVTTFLLPYITHTKSAEWNLKKYIQLQGSMSAYIRSASVKKWCQKEKEKEKLKFFF